LDVFDINPHIIEDWTLKVGWKMSTLLQEKLEGDVINMMENAYKIKDPG